MTLIGNIDRQEAGHWQNKSGSKFTPLPGSGLFANQEGAVSTARKGDVVLSPNTKFTRNSLPSTFYYLQPFQSYARESKATFRNEAISNSTAQPLWPSGANCIPGKFTFYGVN